MSQATLPDNTHLGYVQLSVANLDRALGFYQGILGLNIVVRAPGAATLTAPGSEKKLLVLVEKAGARPKPSRTTGLFHIALRYPHRIALAQALQRLVENRWPLQGASDHRVSEALYLADPDGLGVELYADRPRGTWPRRGEVIEMATDPLDVRALLADTVQAGPEAGNQPVGVDLGHVHLQVADLGEARKFYHEVLGFAVMQEDYPGALFVAAGGYHHHIGLNVWAGAGASAAPPEAVGLEAFSIQLPDGDAFAKLRGRLAGQGINLADLNVSKSEQGIAFGGPGVPQLRVYAPLGG